MDGLAFVAAPLRAARRGQRLGKPSAHGGIIAAFALYAVGFLARPLGGLIFGHIGDKAGRKKALVMTLAIMGAATFAMGLLPTFEQVGYLAPACLVILRVLQGVASGGEWGGGVLLLSLEILVAGDLIRTVAVAPTLDNVIVLGLIVLIRTFLSFSLEIEIDGVPPWRKALVSGATVITQAQKNARDVPDARPSDGAA